MELWNFWLFLCWFWVEGEDLMYSGLINTILSFVLGSINGWWFDQNFDTIKSFEQRDTVKSFDMKLEDSLASVLH